MAELSTCSKFKEEKEYGYLIGLVMMMIWHSEGGMETYWGNPLRVCTCKKKISNPFYILIHPNSSWLYLWNQCDLSTPSCLILYSNKINGTDLWWLRLYICGSDWYIWWSDCDFMSCPILHLRNWVLLLLSLMMFDSQMTYGEITPARQRLSQDRFLFTFWTNSFG